MNTPKPPSVNKGIKTQRLRNRGEAVTIIAGFRFNEGVLLCGDTKNDGGPTPIYQTKLHKKHYPSTAKSVFGIAGRTKFARMAVAACENDLARLDKPTMREMTSVVEDCLLQVHRKHIHHHPSRGIEGGPDFNLIVALWSPVDGAELYSTEDSAIDKVDTYECLGTGEYLGRYIIDVRYKGVNSTLEQLILTATTALVRIKSYDKFCGGTSEFAVIWNDGTLKTERGYDIAQAEEFAMKFFSAATLIYEEMAMSSDTSDDRIQAYTRSLVEVMASHRSIQVKEKRRRDALLGELGKETSYLE